MSEIRRGDTPKPTAEIFETCSNKWRIPGNRILIKDHLKKFWYSSFSKKKIAAKQEIFCDHFRKMGVPKNTEILWTPVKLVVMIPGDTLRGQPNTFYGVLKMLGKLWNTLRKRTEACSENPLGTRSEEHQELPGYCYNGLNEENYENSVEGSKEFTVSEPTKKTIWETFRTRGMLIHLLTGMVEHASGAAVVLMKRVRHWVRAVSKHE